MIAKCLQEKYAELVVKIGVNIQPDQILVINSPIECAEFTRLLTTVAFANGAGDVVVNWNDEQLARIRYEGASVDMLAKFPSWRQELYNGYAQQGAAFISIAAHNPSIFQGIDSNKLTTARQAEATALSAYRMRLMSNKNRWCVVSVPTKEWARRIFPELTDTEANFNLWQAIFKAVHVDEVNDPKEIWGEHIKRLQNIAAFLNKANFRALHYINNLGTDLKIELPKGHIWCGGADTSSEEMLFVANMPTEEIFTVPLRQGVNGKVVATKPLHYQGNLIEGIELVFRDGKVVDYKASEGRDILGNLLSLDEGAKYLGEVALVPYNSPIAESGLLFYNTLFDENASCHLALGKAYPTCIVGGDDMSSEELLKIGINDSLIHEDFMIGSADLTVVGTTDNGEKISIMKKGNFAFEC